LFIYFFKRWSRICFYIESSARIKKYEDGQDFASGGNCKNNMKNFSKRWQRLLLWQEIKCQNKKYEDGQDFASTANQVPK